MKVRYAIDLRGTVIRAEKISDERSRNQDHTNYLLKKINDMKF
jgi:hypothetical protein